MKMHDAMRPQWWRSDDPFYVKVVCLAAAFDMLTSEAVSDRAKLVELPVTGSLGDHVFVVNVRRRKDGTADITAMADDFSDQLHALVTARREE